MLRILLVYDDFQELTRAELMLKKTGFDVVGITSEFSMPEQLLSFNPQVIIAQGQSPKVSSASVGKRLRESLRWDGHSVLIFFPNLKPNPSDILKMRMDVGLEYPVDPAKLVQVLAQLGGLDSAPLLEKMTKSFSQDSKDSASSPFEGQGKGTRSDSVFVSGGKVSPEGQTSLKGGSGAGPEGGRPASGPASTGDARGGGSPEVGESAAQADGASGETQDSNAGPTHLTDPQAPTFPLPSDPETPAEVPNPFKVDMIKDPVMQELENLLGSSGKPKHQMPPSLIDPLRAERYSQYLTQTPPLNLSSIKRREAKSRLRDMVKNIPKETLEDQDDLRREFVKALFKPKG
ncbi:MAG: hypothetical protein ACK5Y2_08455 [Bdellovibrionales bacterium]